MAEGLGELRPGDVFNDSRTWDEVLGPHGWTKFKIEGETTYWARPGVTDHHGATTNHGGSDLLYVFTDATEFEQDRSYTKFGAYAVLEHGGDHAAAARHLASLGYGTGVQAAEEEPAPPGEHAAPASDPSPPRPDEPEPAAMPARGRASGPPQAPPLAPRPREGGHPVGAGSPRCRRRRCPSLPPTPEPAGATDGPVATVPTGKPKSAPPSDEELGIVAMEGLKATPVEWLWPDRFALGKYNLLASVGGEGKSQFATRLIAMITNGEAFPDGSGTAAARDLPVPVVRGRARGHDRPPPDRGRGGHGHVRRADGEADRHDRRQGARQPDELPGPRLLAQIFERTRPVLMVVDPIPAYLGRGRQRPPQQRGAGRPGAVLHPARRTGGGAAGDHPPGQVGWTRRRRSPRSSAASPTPTWPGP